MNWLFDNYQQLLFIITSIIAAASAIAALTPTPKDDNIISKIKQLIDFLALNIGHAKKES